MTVKELIALLDAEHPDAQVLMREPYDDAAEYRLNHVLRRRADCPENWEVVITP